ncbi:hypothetical protein [Rhizobium arsenicireducens]
MIAQWRVQLPQLLHEMVECNPSGGILTQPVNILMGILARVAERAIELDDPALNILMLRLALYDIHPEQTSEAIDQQRERITA